MKKSKLTIYTTMSLPESETDLHSRAPHGTKVICARDYPLESERKLRFLEADVVFGTPPAEWLNEATQLRWLQLESVGIEAYRGQEKAPWTAHIVITNLKGFFGAPVAETLLAGVLSLQRRIPELLTLQARAEWAQEQIRPTVKMLHGGHAVILGAGSIGLHLQKLLHGFGVTTSLYARTSPAAILHRPADLDGALPTADFVFGCLPDTLETAGLMNRNRFELMKCGSIFANGGRGSLVDERALASMLRTGHLGGAVLDVTISEPLPAHHHFWDCPRLILTQHTGGGFDREIAGKTDFFLANLERFQQGLPLRNVVDLSATH